jgi:hypothetical protein
MITLTILNGDGSVYWVEHFSDSASANRWLSEERTRPYWKSEFTWRLDSVVPSASDVAAFTAKAVARQARLDRLKAADLSALTLAQLRPLFKDIIDHLNDS